MSATPNCSGIPLVTLSVTETGEVRYSARTMTEGQCEMVLAKMPELRSRLGDIRLTVEAERQYRASIAA